MKVSLLYAIENFSFLNKFIRSLSFVKDNPEEFDQDLIESLKSAGKSAR